MKKFWFGVKGTVNTPFEATEPEPTETSHTQFDYVVGPFQTMAEAEIGAQKHVNKDGTFKEISKECER